MNIDFSNFIDNQNVIRFIKKKSHQKTKYIDIFLYTCIKKKYNAEIFVPQYVSEKQETDLITKLLSKIAVFQHQRKIFQIYILFYFFIYLIKMKILNVLIK